MVSVEPSGSEAEVSEMLESAKDSVSLSIFSHFVKYA